MNKSSIVFGNYDKSILPRDHDPSSKIEETELSEESPSES